MRHRPSQADHEQDGSMHHEPNQQKSPSRQRKRQRRKQHSAVILVKFGTLFVISAVVMFVAIDYLLRVPDGTIREDSEQLHQNEHHVQSNGSKCPLYGCPITAAEILTLDIANSTDVVSEHHLILTHKSNRKVPAPVNQDRAVLVSPFTHEGMETARFANTNNFLMGIFDGHDNAGGDVAQFAMEQVPKRIAQKLQDAMTKQQLLDPASTRTIPHDVVKEVIIQAHEETDSTLPSEQSIMGGCTSTVVLRLGSTLYMSNVGDSYSYLVTYTPPANGLQNNNMHILNDQQQPHLQGNITIHHENVRHKPHLPEESARIKSLGGRIHVPPPPKNPMGSRVIVKSSAHNEDVGLAMSRSIGDLEWTRVGVIPTPDVAVVDLNIQFDEMDESSKLFVVVASDGLFDNRRKEFVTRHLARVLFESGELSSDAATDVDHSQHQRSMLDGAKKLVAAASPLKEEWYRDDISFVAKIIEL